MYSQLKNLIFTLLFSFPLTLTAAPPEDPVALANEWLEIESRVGDSHWARIATVATASTKGEVQARNLGMTSLTDQGAVFFTHRSSRKVKHFKENPTAAVNLWMPKTTRQVSMHGRVEFVTREEAEAFWKSYHRRGKLMFLASDHVSKMEGPSDLLSRYEQLEASMGKEIPMPDEFIGFRVIPDTFIFYEIRTDDLPRKIVYYRDNGVWVSNYYQP